MLDVGRRAVLGIFIFLSLVYIGLTFGIPADVASIKKYNLDNSELQLIRLSLVVPIVAIWLTAYYGYAKFKRYSETVKGSLESTGWSYIVKGLLALGLYLPINSIANAVGSYIYHENYDLTPTIVIITNYLSLSLIFLAFALLYKGSSTLVKNLNKPLPALLEGGSMVFLLAVSSVFAHLTLSNANRSVEVSSSIPAAYYLPDWLLVLTIIVPYITIFYLGIHIALDLFAYKTNVKGFIYKSALTRLANGIGFAVVAVMVLRSFASLSSAFNEAALKGLLLIIYLLIFVIAIGYILIALGAKKLQKIEEV